MYCKDYKEEALRWALYHLPREVLPDLIGLDLHISQEDVDAIIAAQAASVDRFGVGTLACGW
eukprot:3038396-Alexandrium_andersonii.AAC.1